MKTVLALLIVVSIGCGSYRSGQAATTSANKNDSLTPTSSSPASSAAELNAPSSESPQPQTQESELWDPNDDLHVAGKMLERVKGEGAIRIVSVHPSRDKYVFVAEVEGEREGGSAQDSTPKTDLWLVNKNGTGLRRLTDDKDSNQFPYAHQPKILRLGFYKCPGDVIHTQSQAALNSQPFGSRIDPRASDWNRALSHRRGRVLRMIIEPEMIAVPAGEFLMGCAAGADNERRVHCVFVGEFAIGCFAVTNRLYQFFIEDTGQKPPPGWDDPRFNHPDQPVTSVSWFDATAYCEWLSEKTGKLYRLPTEAEWERAARGGLEGKLYTWGDEAPKHQPRYAELWFNGPERLGQRQANGFGLYDISENIHEWCSDWYDERYYVDSPSRNPQGPVIGTRRSSRGGSWRHQIKITRVAARSSIPPEFKYSDYGFRCARTL